MAIVPETRKEYDFILEGIRHGLYLVTDCKYLQKILKTLDESGRVC